MTALAPSVSASRDGLREAEARLRTLAPTSPAAEVERWLLTLAGRRREESRAAIARMYVYRPLIEEALAKHGVPRDLLYLPLIESGFSVRATSRVGAAGIWQFMPATARGYGLEVSSYVDERRDPVRSTFAAIAHLRDLEEGFGSWHVAAAAYNAGSGRVTRALRHRTSADQDYWTARRQLPPETRAYVPKFLAAARMGRHPERFGLAPAITPAPLAFREVRVPGGVPFPVLAPQLRVSVQQLQDLNPHLIRDQTPPGRVWPVRVPVN